MRIDHKMIVDGGLDKSSFWMIPVAIAAVGISAVFVAVDAVRGTLFK